mgnify:CR=1 FL=1
MKKEKQYQILSQVGKKMLNNKTEKYLNYFLHTALKALKTLVFVSIGAIGFGALFLVPYIFITITLEGYPLRSFEAKISKYAQKH